MQGAKVRDAGVASALPTEDGGTMGNGTDFRVGFLGAGKMATALAKGWINASLVSRDRVLASDPAPAARDAFVAATGARATADNREVVAFGELLVLAVKPQTMAGCLAEIRPSVTGRHLVVSIAAGVTLRQLAEGL